MTNGEGSGAHDPTDQGEPTEGELRAADEWEGRERKLVDDLNRQDLERLDAEQEAERQRLLTSLDMQAQALLERVNASVTGPVLAEEQANDRRKLAQLELELNQIRAMRKQEENAAVEARRATRDTFRKLVREKYDKPETRVESTIRTDTPTAQDLADLRLLVDDIRVEQGLEPKYGERPQAVEDLKVEDSTQVQGPVDKHQAMRNRAADSI